MITIEQIFGTRAGVENTPTNLDAILWHDPLFDKPRQIGFAMRVPGAEIFIHYGIDVPDAVISEAKKKLSERDFGGSEVMQAIAAADAGNRRVTRASGVEEETDDDD